MVSVVEKWTQEYGPLIHIKLFGQSAIIASTPEIVKDLLETRSKNYSNRPNFIMASEAMQGDMMMSFISVNERFHKFRKLLSTELRPSTLAPYANPVQAAEIHRLLKNILDAPQDWSENIFRSITSTITTVCYDKPLGSGEEASETVQNIMKINADLADAVNTGKNYVDFLPWLRYVPGIPYKALAAEYYERADLTYKTLLDDVKSNVATGNYSSSIASRVLERAQNYEADYREQYWALGALYLAGSDTMAVTSECLFMALALHPHVLKCAKKEVDSVVGPDRLPTFADEGKLPYINAAIREVLRWRPVGPFSIPHAAAEDDVYNGYFIPKGSIILPNLWTIYMDESIFDNPETFDPQRYIDNPDLPSYTFGFGRRACLGQRFAEQTLFLELATLVWACDIRQAIDAQGKPIPIDSARETGFTLALSMRPKPFKVSITPRSPERAKLLYEIVSNEGL